MSYIGSSAAPLPVAFSGVRTQSFSGTGSQTAFTLSRAVSAVTDIEVVVNNVQQSPFDSSYNISGATLTFSEAPSSGTNNIYVIFRDQPVGSLADPTSVKKAGDSMTGALNINGATVNTNANWGAYINPKSGGAVGEFTLTDPTGNFGRVNVDGSGIVTLPFQPSFRYHNPTSYAVPANGGVLSFTTKQHDATNSFSGTIFTAPAAGTYLFSACVGYQVNSASGQFNYYIQKNGTSLFGNETNGYVLYAGNWQTLYATGIVSLVKNDQITVNVGSSSAVTQIDNSLWTYFSGQKLS